MESVDERMWSLMYHDTVSLWPHAPVASIASYFTSQQERTRRIRLSMRHPEMMMMLFRAGSEDKNDVYSMLPSEDAMSYVRERVKHPETDNVERKDLTKALKLLEAMDEINVLHRAILQGNFVKASRILSKGAR